MDVTITADMVLSFDFLSDVEGEVQGIGFASNGNISQNNFFQLDGTQSFGNQVYDDLYTTGSGEQHYEIAVGDYFTGTFDQIVFMMDDDAYVGADSTFSDVLLV